MAEFRKAERPPDGAPENPGAILKQKVESAIAEVRPYLQADGGDVELIALEGQTVKVRLKGACGCCPMAMMTLKAGIEQVVRQRAPEVREVVAVP